MQRAPLIHIVVGQSVRVFEPLVCVDQALLIYRNTFLSLNLGLDIQYRVVLFKFEGGYLTGESLDEEDVSLRCLVNK